MTEGSPYAYSVSPQCVSDLYDVAKLALAISLTAGGAAGGKKPVVPIERQTEIVHALVSASICFHLEDNPKLPFACTVCMDYRARQRFPLGSLHHPVRVPSVVHRASALQNCSAWLYASVDSTAWVKSDDMGPWKLKRATLLTTIAPRASLSRTLEQIVSMAIETEQERADRPMHFLAAKALYMGYCACSAFVPNNVVVSATDSSGAIVGRLNPRSGGGGGKRGGGKRFPGAMSAARRDHYMQTAMKRSHGRGRVERVRRFSENCARLKYEVMETMQLQQQLQQPSNAEHAAEGVRAQAPPMPTLTVIQALLIRDEALCRILLACYTLLAVTFASTLALDASDVPVWNKAKRTCTPMNSEADKNDVLRIQIMLNAALSQECAAEKTAGCPLARVISVFTVDGCGPKTTYGKPSATAFGTGFLADATLPRPVTTRVQRVLRQSGSIAWPITMPALVSSLLAILYDYLSDRFGKRPRAGAQDHENGVRAVVDSAMADRSVYFQRVIESLARGGLDAEDARTAEDATSIDAGAGARQPNDPYADISSVLRAAFASLPTVRG